MPRFVSLKRRVSYATAAILLAAAFGVAAQSPAPGAEKARPRGERFECSKAPDPKACEERRQKGRDAYAKANQACEGKQGDERRSCLRTNLCAQAPDPAACRARGAEHEKRQAERRQSMEKAHDSCKGKPGDEARACMRASLCAQAPDPVACKARSDEQEKRYAERRQAMEKAREDCKGKQGDEMKACMRAHRPAHRMHPAPKA